MRIFGKRFEEHRQEILEQMNFTSPYVAFPIRLTVFENLMVFARMYNLPHPRAKIAELAKLFGIEELLRKPVSRLSSGETTRIGLCKAFMNDPKVLLLDEPTAYLDPQIASQVKGILLDMQRERGTTILYTSHNMAEVERMCPRIIFLSRGRVLASGTPIEVTQTILKEDRDEPALEEVFLHVAQGKPMKPHRIKAVMLRHTYEARRNMDRVIDMVYWPVLDIIVWGFFTIYLGAGIICSPG